MFAKRTQRDGGCLKARKGALTRNQIDWYLNLGLRLLGFRTVRKNMPLFKPPNL